MNWTAPRLFAVAFTPWLAGIILTATAIATITLAPRPGQEGQEIPVITAMSLCFIAAHALHLWLIGKTLKADGS